MENLWKFSTMNLDQFRTGTPWIIYIYIYICWICFCCHFDGKGNDNIQLEINLCHEMTARSCGNSHVEQGTLPKNVFNWTIFPLDMGLVSPGDVRDPHTVFLAMESLWYVHS